MINYVLGFLFSEDKKRVCLILKKKPENLAGKYNGVGGKFEKDEEGGMTMLREFKEETGVIIPIEKWNYKASLESKDKWSILVYTVYSDIALANVKTIEEEEIGVYDVDKLPELNLVSNLRWLIPLILDKNLMEPPHIYVK